LTLTSRPVFGFQEACMTPSRMISGNHSGFKGPSSCAGVSLKDRADEAKLSGNEAPDWTQLQFSEAFGSQNPYLSSTTSLSGKPQKKLGELLLDSFAGNDTNPRSVPGFAAYAIAAYVNVLEQDSVANVLKIPQVQHMWNDVIANGGYCPLTGMCWTATGVIGYLQNSGIVPPT
jgi:hypothetical protein